ncbi:hypothetical protein M407DRAFT_91741 [Tulasnella calospora MUT 4182]|uniref:Uncharacterized protein n=1 Tax=Tulasnella calospora MUT 4182 TaxID=1051891 RepID=A0A0C3LVS5_9AGAM|nr:hypothetical protein M407DRAFT_91741 [Tulasnella calospora MUT 4182]
MTHYWQASAGEIWARYLCDSPVAVIYVSVVCTRVLDGGGMPGGDAARGGDP